MLLYNNHHYSKNLEYNLNSIIEKYNLDDNITVSLFTDNDDELPNIIIKK